MELHELPESSPAGLLAWDEAFLEATEAGEAGQALWFWESPRPFVVLGYGQRAALEADLGSCAAEGVPVLRRCSGGGAVVQGPGCLNYALVLRTMESGPLATIAGTNTFIMERQRRAAERASGLSVRVEGHTDLAVGGMKFSGNAQRRRRNALLFHGTVLHDFDLEVIARWLRFPSARPAYRGGRGHLDFLRNLPASPEGIREAIAAEWDARPARRPLPTERHATALRERYDIAAWHARA